MFLALVMSSKHFSTLQMMRSPSPIVMTKVRSPRSMVNPLFFWILEIDFDEADPISYDRVDAYVYGIRVSGTEWYVNAPQPLHICAFDFPPVEPLVFDIKLYVGMETFGEDRVLEGILVHGNLWKI